MRDAEMLSKAGSASSAVFILLFLPIVFCLLVFSATSVNAVSIRTSFISVSVAGVVPGEDFSLRENGGPVLKIFNRGSEKVKVKVEAVEEKIPLFPPLSKGDDRGICMLAEPSWIKFEKDTLEIPAGSSAETDIIIKVPEEKRYFGGNFYVCLMSQTESSGKMFSAGLRSKLFFQTVERKTLWKKIKGIFKK
ncbi:MAG: hypothetical protein ABIJ15_06385 [bacterium]